jgi:REP element-mobilizing transposase RayT
MNRGYDGRPIFLDDEDKEAFIGLMEKAQGLTKVSVLAYCVMDNHYHLLLVHRGRCLPFCHLGGIMAA